jgi:methylmalonyl-CoA mutase C-terminal domain/subunit
MAQGRPVRILIAKPGLDGHERGALVLVRALREDGFEVDYTGIRHSPEAIALRAKESGADAMGLSILSGAHMELIPRVLDAMRDLNLDDLPVLVGGIIPEEDKIALLEMGIVAVFGPGSRTDEIAARFREVTKARRGRA